MTTTGQAKNMAKGQDAARDKAKYQATAPANRAGNGGDKADKGNAKHRAPPNARFAAAEDDDEDIDDDEAMIEESFSVGGSDVYD